MCIRDRLNTPSSKRQFIMYEALRKGATIDEIQDVYKRQVPTPPLSTSGMQAGKDQALMCA